MIGGKAYTQKEWDQTIDRFDEAEENLQEQVDQAEEEAAQKAMSESDIHIAYERMRKPRRDKPISPLRPSSRHSPYNAPLAASDPSWLLGI